MKQLFHWHLLDMRWLWPTQRHAPRWLSTISYPTRPRGIIVKCTFMVGCEYTLLLVTNVKPLYDAYTTYLPLASCKGLAPRTLGDHWLLKFSFDGVRWLNWLQFPGYSLSLAFCLVKSETGVFWPSVESIQIRLERHSISSRLDFFVDPCVVGKHNRWGKL